MPTIRLTLLNGLWAVLIKDSLCEFRTPYAVSTLFMFAFISLASISMSAGVVVLSTELIAALAWIIIFFCAMAGLSRVFVQEQESGTLTLLRIYATAQAVWLGKLLLNVIMLFGLTFFIIPLLIMFLHAQIDHWSMLILILILGDIGIAAAATITAALVAKTQGKNALFTVLTFPILLPQFLSSISATAKILAGTQPDLSELLLMAAYNVVVMIASSILFDYLWYDC